MKKLILLAAILSFLFFHCIFSQEVIWEKKYRCEAGAVFAKDDNVILTSDFGRFIELDIESGEIIRSSEKFTSEIRNFEVSQDETFIVALNYLQDTISIIDYNNFKIIDRIIFNSDTAFVKAITISPDNQNLAIGLTGRPNYLSRLRIINLETKKTTHDIIELSITSLKYSPNNLYLAAITVEHFPYPNNDRLKYRLKLYDDNYEIKKELDETNYQTNKIEEIYSINFSDDSDLLLQSNYLYPSKIWDMNDFKKIKEIELPNDGNYTDIKITLFAEKYNYLIFGTRSTRDYDLKIYDFIGDTIVYEYYNKAIGFIDLSNNEDMLLGGRENKIARYIPYWTMTDVNSEKTEIPLMVNYSKGFLSVEYELKSPILNEINLIDNSGKIIKSIYSGLSHEGLNHIQESIDLNSGVYYVQVKVGNRETVKKILVVR